MIDDRERHLKKYQCYTFNYLKKVRKKIVDDPLKENVITYIILKRENRLVEYYSKESIKQLRKEKQEELDKNKIYFGYKKEAYYTEEEMIEGFKCSYEDLSESEKAMYNFKK